MQEGYPLSLRADARLFVDELNAGGATALQHRVQVVDRKANVMDSGPALRHESRDRRPRIVRLKKLDQSLAGAEARYPGAIGIVEANLAQAQHIAKKGKTLGERLYRDPNVGHSNATRA